MTTVAMQVDDFEYTDLQWNPPAEDFDAEQDRISRLLDDETFLSTGAFRGPASGTLGDW